MPGQKPAPEFESLHREQDRERQFHSGPWGMPLHFRNVEVGRDEFGPFLEMQEVDADRMQSGNLSDAPDDGGPDAAPGNRRGWSPL